MIMKVNKSNTDKKLNTSENIKKRNRERYVNLLNKCLEKLINISKNRNVLENKSTRKSKTNMTLKYLSSIDHFLCKLDN